MTVKVGDIVLFKVVVTEVATDCERHRKPATVVSGVPYSEHEDPEENGWNEKLACFLEDVFPMTPAMIKAQKNAKRKEIEQKIKDLQKELANLD